MRRGITRTEGLSLTALYAGVVAVYFVLPLGGRLRHVFLGTATFPHDAFLNAGILEWGVPKPLGS